MVLHKINPDLELRLLRPEDAAALFALIEGNRAQLREWLPWVDVTVKVAQTEKFIAKTLRQCIETQAFAVGIWSSGALVGVIRHNRIDWTSRVAFPGWWLVPAAQGKGIMTQSVQAVCVHAFGQLKLNRVIVGVATENLRGQAVVKRLGFTLISTLRNAEWLGKRRVDHFIYSLLPPAPGAGATARPQ